MAQYSNFAQKPVDKRSRSAMSLFLLKHYRYGMDFCANVKIRNLHIPRDLQDRAYELLEMEAPCLDIENLMEDFTLEHGHVQTGNGTRVGFEGRSNGYICLYGAESQELERGNNRYDDLSMAELRDLCRLVESFDRLCDDCVAEFMHYATDYHAEQIEVTTTKAVTILVPNE